MGTPENQNPSKNDLEYVCTIGGEFDETIISLVVYSEKLDRQKVTELLEVVPTKAWNHGEPHSIGRSGKILTTDWGQWYLDSPRDREPINDKIIELLNKCTQNLNNWRFVSESYEIYLVIVGHLENWNREINISLPVLKMLVDRNIELSLDIYFWNENGEEKHNEENSLKSTSQPS